MKKFVLATPRGLFAIAHPKGLSRPGLDIGYAVATPRTPAGFKSGGSQQKKPP